MRSGVFCKYKACGATTKHISGYCHTHNKQWMAGYRYALKELSGPQPAEAGTGRTMLIDSGAEMSDEPGRDNHSLSFEFTYGREGQGVEGVRCQDSMGLPTLPHLARPGDGPGGSKEKNLGCGISETN
jgi:hypothetical protein